ncbi:MAG: hypothetical protein KC474_08275 [Cyanobacteria bacterium HKST-UBA04]|nr:hypothetical protein [Cyanobacteria bacterium HKST-UBA04]MCA9842575.1 hypothetical protein [Cyanobacteria bacterium HKST-UBA03]
MNMSVHNQMNPQAMQQTMKMMAQQNKINNNNQPNTRVAKNEKSDAENKGDSQHTGIARRPPKRNRGGPGALGSTIC